MDSYELEKLVWYDSDFEVMGWHDARIWSMLTVTSQFDFERIQCVFPHSARPGSAATDRGKNDGATVLEPLDDGIVGYARQISQAFVEGRVVKARQKLARHELVAAEFASMEMHPPDILWAHRMRSQLIRRTGFRRGRDGCRC